MQIFNKPNTKNLGKLFTYAFAPQAIKFIKFICLCGKYVFILNIFLISDIMIFTSTKVTLV